MILQNRWLRVWLSVVGGGTAVLLFLVLLWGQRLPSATAETADATQSNTTTTFGYGFNVAAWDTDLIQSIGFNWIKVFNMPGSRLPLNVLVRLSADYTDMADLDAFGNEIYQLALSGKGLVEAYEIGNEPNLDASYGWGTAPNAADYAQLLCTAYTKIKQADPNALVVSAGLAPTGRVSGNWNGHPGHNGLYQDEREYFKEFLAAGGGNCLDVVGYHPYGFSADYNAAPDVASADPTQNCTNGFCFRGVEKIYEIMQTNGLGNKQVWATEFGWLVEPPSNCLSDPGWQGRQWQIVSEAKQASNLAGAYTYATNNWPWMGAMFVFNLNFNQPGLYAECEQMRYYAVAGRQAETALRDMPKVKPTGELHVLPASIGLVITPTQQPYTATVPVIVSNVGESPFTYTVSLATGTSLTLTVVGGSGLNGTLNKGEQAQFSLMITSNGRSVGTYTSTMTITADANTTNSPINIPVSLYIFHQINNTYLPVITQP
ncbi:MAG: hypothetical protein D6706_04240 [Chloroflexi bacterium]|nr:MAG: hypothetical protein D6706_04240 [Chloroflexota bacterium]